MLFFEAINLLTGMLTAKGLSHRWTANKRIIFITFPDHNEEFPENLTGELPGILRDWLSETLPGIPLGKLPGSLTGSLTGSPNETRREKPPITYQPGIFNHTVKIDWGTLETEERKALIHRKARGIIQEALRHQLDFLSVKDVRLMAWNYLGEVLSIRQARHVLLFLEEKEVIIKNGNLQTKGRELNLVRARSFLAGK